MNHLPVIHVWTHDSVGLGEDGPTHQPVEHLAAIRSIPKFTLIRPCDSHETREAWRAALLNTSGPTGIVLSRQKVTFIDRNKYSGAEKLHQGAYILAESPLGAPQLILIASGSEVGLALEVRERLTQEQIGCRVVSMPSWELFEKQSQWYRETVLPPQIRKRISIEAGVSLGWCKWIGDEGVSVAVDRYGMSAPADLIFKNFGFTVDRVIQTAKDLLRKQKTS